MDLPFLVQAGLCCPPFSLGLIHRAIWKELSSPPTVLQHSLLTRLLTGRCFFKGKRKQGQFCGVNKIYLLNDLAPCMEKECLLEGALCLPSHVIFLGFFKHFH